ncbi:NADPH-dependent FMN reductase [Mailhella massiliensis]|uniref:NADPH-dependent FMN reductase n=1 Tax=Mailhella massiliensis TaxID=1903261 RepID=UPI00097E1210|nr:NADPH-dependent FMN reductase [Mailhella massiliensis]
MKKKNFLGICGSLRAASRNSGLLRCAREQMPEGSELVIADIADIPFYVEGRETPESVKRLAEEVKAADALVLAVPEYNYSVAPALKNALDWLSREPGDILAGKPAAMMGAGGGMGTARAQYHLRQSCVYLDIRLLNRPEVFANAFSEAFTPQGDVSDEPEGRKLREKVAALMRALDERVRQNA